MSIRNLTRVTSYDDARRHFQDTKPIRGTGKELAGVPLCRDRRDAHMCLKHNPYNLNAYECWLYYTPVVTYYPDGRVRVDLRYASQLTCNYAYNTLPHGLHPALYRGKSHINGYLAYKNPLVFKEIDGKLELIDGYTPMFVRRVDRSKGAAARKSIAPFMAFAKVMCATNEVGWLSNMDISYGVLTDGTPEEWAHRVQAMGHRLPLIKNRAYDTAYKACDAYYYEELPPGVMHPKMQGHDEIPPRAEIVFHEQ